MRLFAAAGRLRLSKVSRNIVYNLAGQVLTAILGFIAFRYVFRRVGDEAIGIIYFSLTLNTVLCAVLELGISATTVRQVSAHFRDEPDYIRDLIRTASLFYWALYLAAAVVLYAAAPLLIANWVNVHTLDHAVAVRVLRIVGIASLTVLPRSLYTSVFRGLERMELNNAIDVVTMGLQPIGTIVILVLGGGLSEIAFWFACCFILSTLAYLVVTGAVVSWDALVPMYSPSVVQRNVGFSFHLMLISILAVIQTQGDKLVVSKLLPLGVFGYYAVASGLASKATVVISAIALAASPSLSGLFQRGDRAALLGQYRKLHDLLCFATAPLFAAIYFAAFPIFRYLFNGDVAQMLMGPMRFLCLGFYLSGTLHVPYAFSIAIGKPAITTRAHLYALLISVPVTILATMRFGLIGAALSLVLHDLVLYVYWIPRICRECLEVPAAQWYQHIVKILALIGGTYGVAWMLVASSGPLTLQRIAAAYVAASLVFALGAYRMLDEELQASASRLLHAVTVRNAET